MQSLLSLKDQIKAAKNRLLRPGLSKLHKFGFTANHSTFISFLCGLAAAYFLFLDHTLFSIFLILSVIFDIFDGALSQIEKKEGSGWHWDLASDRTVTWLILLKTGLHFAWIAVLPLILAYLFIVIIIIYLNIRQNREVKYTFNIAFVYLAYLFQAYTLGLYILLLSLIYSLVVLTKQASPPTK